MVSYITHMYISGSTAEDSRDTGSSCSHSETVVSGSLENSKVQLPSGNQTWLDTPPTFDGGLVRESHRGIFKLECLVSFGSNISRAVYHPHLFLREVDEPPEKPKLATDVSDFPSWLGK